MAIAATLTLAAASLFACMNVALTTLETAADEAAAQGCDMLFLPTDPALAPLCVTVADLVAAGAALGLDLLDSGKLLDAGTPDGGSSLSAHARVSARDPATNARVYAWLLAHGAVPLGG